MQTSTELDVWLRTAKDALAEFDAWKRGEYVREDGLETGYPFWAGKLGYVLRRVVEASDA